MGIQQEGKGSKYPISKEAAATAAAFERMGIAKEAERVLRSNYYRLGVDRGKAKQVIQALKGFGEVKEEREW